MADTALLVAATGGWVEVVETLVSARAVVDHRNSSGETALIRSAMHSDPRAVQVGNVFLDGCPSHGTALLLATLLSSACINEWHVPLGVGVASFCVSGTPVMELVIVMVKFRLKRDT